MGKTAKIIIGILVIAFLVWGGIFFKNSKLGQGLLTINNLVEDSYVTYFVNDPTAQAIPYFTVITNGLAAPQKVDIITKSGTIVKNNLYTGGASSGNTFSWDMKDNAGALVPTGKYKFRAVIAGDEGTQYEGKQQRIESPLFMIFNNPAQ
jgi:hypothetical protein